MFDLLIESSLLSSDIGTDLQAAGLHTRSPSTRRTTQGLKKQSRIFWVFPLHLNRRAKTGSQISFTCFSR
jgi:hypothetical protein